MSTARFAADCGGGSVADQAALDACLLELDGTPNKTRLGANAILAVSLAFARAHAIECGLPLYRHFAAMLGQPVSRMPRMTINLFSGGKHAGAQVAIQDVLIVPASASTIDDGLVMASAVYRAAVRLIRSKYGLRWLTADEGGLRRRRKARSNCSTTPSEAIRDAGLRPGADVSLAVGRGGEPFLPRWPLLPRREPLASVQMIDLLLRLGPCAGRSSASRTAWPKRTGTIGPACAGRSATAPWSSATTCSAPIRNGSPGPSRTAPAMRCC